MSGKPYKKNSAETPKRGHLTTTVLAGGILKFYAQFTEIVERISDHNKAYIAAVRLVDNAIQAEEITNLVSKQSRS